MKRQLLALLLLCTAIEFSQAQLGGRNIYEFLNLPASARISALGGNLITVRDDDINLGYANPSLLNPEMHQQISFNHNFNLAGISNGYAAYGHSVDKLNMTFQLGVKYINYGTFDATNDLGMVEGTFDAGEYAVVAGGSWTPYERLALGVNLRFISSQFERYNSIGFSGDVAATYFDTASNFTATVLLKHVGGQLNTYREGNFEPIPFEMQLGFSKKLRYLPFRLSVVYHHFNRWNVLYDDPENRENTLFLGEIETERSPASIWFDNFTRHFIFSGEFLFGKKENFRVRVGYNHMLRKELSVQNFRSLGGFSFGLGLKVNRFRLDFGRTTYHLAGGYSHIGISTNIRSFKAGGIETEKKVVEKEKPTRAKKEKASKETAKKKKDKKKKKASSDKEKKKNKKEKKKKG